MKQELCEKTICEKTYETAINFVYWESKLLALSDLICMLEFNFTLQDLPSHSFDFLQATPEVVQVF